MLLDLSIETLEGFGYLYSSEEDWLPFLLTSSSLRTDRVNVDSFCGHSVSSFLLFLPCAALDFCSTKVRERTRGRPTDGQAYSPIQLSTPICYA